MEGSSNLRYSCVRSYSGQGLRTIFAPAADATRMARASIRCNATDDFLRAGGSKLEWLCESMHRGLGMNGDQLRSPTDTPAA